MGGALVAIEHLKPHDLLHTQGNRSPGYTETQVATTSKSRDGLFDEDKSLTMKSRLCLNSQSSCLSLLSNGVIGTYYPAWLLSFN